MATTISSPGKVMLIGGYLVLEEPNAGLVAAVSCRFFSTVSSTEHQSQANESFEFPVNVTSPQLNLSYVYVFRCDLREGTKQCTLRQTEGSTNVFVEASVLYALTTVCSVKHDVMAATSGLSVSLQADNSFYSQIDYLNSKGLQLSLQALSDVPRFNPVGTNVSKTGLGSSATLVSATICAILAHFNTVIIPSRDSPNQSCSNEAPLTLLAAYRIAQFAHCIAQGKIGSGFDVCSAMFGCCVYTRFPTSLLGPPLEQFPLLVGRPSSERSPEPLDAEEFARTVAGVNALPSTPAEASWLQHLGLIRPFVMPKGLSLMLADVHGGSSTPGMVAKVLAWKDKADGFVWRRLSELNKRVTDDFLWLRQVDSSVAYADVIHAFAVVSGSDWLSVYDRIASASSLPVDSPPSSCQVAATLIRLRDRFREIRDLLRQMGEGAGVDIEPSAQSVLADATMSVPGVLVAGVPGAGGFDALFAVLMHDTAKTEVENLWTSWAGPTDGGECMRVCPMIVSNDAFGGVVWESPERKVTHCMGSSY